MGDAPSRPPAVGQANEQGNARNFLVRSTAMADGAVAAQRLPVIGGHYHDRVLPPGLLQQPLEEEAQIAVRVPDLSVVEIAQKAEIGCREKVRGSVESSLCQPPWVCEGTQVAFVKAFQAVCLPLEVIVHLICVQQEEEWGLGRFFQVMPDDSQLVGNHGRVLR